MRNIFAYLSVLFLSLSSHSMNDYNNIDFDFDLDFFGIEEAKSTINNMIDNGWRFLGFDSNAYASTKKILNEPDFRIELVLALLATEKYPRKSNAKTVFTWLMNEIRLGNMCSASAVFDRISFIKNTESFKAIYNTVRSLSCSERNRVIKNILNREPMIVTGKTYGNLSDEQCELMEDCLKPMLESYVYEE